jgi:hypothetical protein
MKKIQELIRPVETKPGGPRSAREAVIQEALERINSERRGTQYKPATAKGLTFKVTHLSLFDLQWHVQECKKSKSFGACFFGRLKPSEKNKKTN